LTRETGSANIGNQGDPAKCARDFSCRTEPEDPAMRRPLSVRRSAAVLLVAVVALLANAAPATACTTHDRARAATTWLAGQLTDGERIQITWKGLYENYPDLTAKAVLAFDAAGIARDHAENATAWLATPAVARGYVGDGVTTSSVVAHAQLALVAEAQSLDPTDFGGVDLIAELQALMEPTGRFAGLRNGQVIGDGLGQALAVIALHRHGGAPPLAVDFLENSQCPGGEFGVGTPASCGSATAAVTSLAVQALTAVGRTEAIDPALDLLQSMQRPNGGIGNALTEDTVQTSLAATAFHLGGRTVAEDLARGLIETRQMDCDALTERGAISIGNGIVNGGLGLGAMPDIEATAAAIQALARVPLAEVTAAGSQPHTPVLACP
jgi:hypothetical protein